MPTADLSKRDKKDALLVKEEVTNDAEVFEEVVVDVEGSQRGEPSSSVLLLVSTSLLWVFLGVFPFDSLSYFGKSRAP